MGRQVEGLQVRCCWGVKCHEDWLEGSDQEPPNHCLTPWLGYHLALPALWQVPFALVLAPLPHPGLRRPPPLPLP